MTDLIIFTVGARTPDQGKYAEFMTSPCEKSIDEYIEVMQETVDDDWEIVKHKKHYQCVSTEPQIITRK